MIFKLGKIGESLMRLLALEHRSRCLAKPIGLYRGKLGIVPSATVVNHLGNNNMRC